MTELGKVLRALARSGARVTIIGGAATRLQGSSYLTEDVDLAFARTRENAERLAEALTPFHPRPRNLPSGLPFIFDAHVGTTQDANDDVG